MSVSAVMFGWKKLRWRVGGKGGRREMARGERSAKETDWGGEKTDTQIEGGGGGKNKEGKTEET